MCRFNKLLTLLSVLSLVCLVLVNFAFVVHAEPDSDDNVDINSTDTEKSITDGTDTTLEVTPSPTDILIEPLPGEEVENEENSNSTYDISADGVTSPYNEDIGYNVNDVVERLDNVILWLTLLTGCVFWTVVLFVCFWLSWIILKQFNRFL